jgi:hypothetical protein
MEYNTKRNRLVIPEYGRNVQKMVEYAITLEDKEKRNELAKQIVKIMTQMHISSGSYGDYTHKIWDHLFIISDFLLDVDAPYPLPDKSKIEKDPKPIEYSDGKIRHRTYGRNLQKIIQKAIEWEEGEEKEALVKLIANNLKKAYLNWNSSSVDDEQIVKDLDKLSGGKLKLPEGYVFPTSYDLVGKKKTYSKDNRGSQNRGAQNKGRKNYRSDNSGRNDNKSQRYSNSGSYKKRSY